MNILYKALFLSLTLWGTTSCNYLDIVPDEATKESDTYADRQSGENYLYSCYSYLPSSSNAASGLDLLTGDEVITSFEHETFSTFPKGTYTASNPVISYWNTLFQGIRQCYLFLDKIDKFPETSDEQKNVYRGEAYFLLGYYHFLLARCYGPIILVKELPDINMKVQDYPGRSPYDECVQWICDKFDEAERLLPATRDAVLQYGLATKAAAKALKAKMLLYAASPLFNGDKYADMKDPDGNHLMPQAYDPQKWIKAKNALKEAITSAESAGLALYTRNDYPSNNSFPANGIQRRMRMIGLDWKDGPNPEIIFADTRGIGGYDIQPKSVPRGVHDGWNGIAPTWNMLLRFYTKNGLPWDEDPTYKNVDKLDVVTVSDDQESIAKPGNKTIRFNLDREPRFYAWIGFQSGYYEILNADPNNKAYPDSYIHGTGRVVLDFTKNGNQGRKGRNNNYSPTGYLNKKFTYPELGARNSGGNPIRNHPWPIVRLADIYLAYAEACVETNDLNEAKLYLNKVRERAGIPTVEASWAMVPGVTLNQEKLRQIVRQERMIELFLENQNFWDMRRWLLAKEYFGQKAKGMNIEATTIEDFATLKEVDFVRQFSESNYLLPIPITDINRNGRLNNNPGY